MFGSPKILISYNARLRRARVQFAAGECFKSRRAPLSQLRRIQYRLEQEKEDGHIETFALFTRRFEELWQHIRGLEGSIDPLKTIKMTIAQGGRLYEEIALEAPANAESAPLLTCHFTARRVQTIPFNAFVFNVILKCESLKIDGQLDRAQLRFLYLLLQNGQTLTQIPLKMQPKYENYGKPFLVQLDPQHHFATLHIFDPRCLASTKACEQLWDRSIIQLNRLNSNKLRLQLLKEHSLEKLHSLVHKMQGFGYGMPYDLLIAYDVSYKLNTLHLKAEKVLAEHDQADLPRWKMRLGAQPRGDYFQIDVAHDDMSARIVTEHKTALQKVRASIDLEWVRREFEKQRVVSGTETFIEDIWKAIQQERTLVGMKVAQGTPAKPGAEVYLQLAAQAAAELASSSQDIRESQNRSLVKAGELVAEVRCRDGIPGQNVRGKVIHALGPARGRFTAGEGIELRGESEFYATRDGILSVDGSTLVCEKAYIHKGPVNLATGNLSFDGAVVVQGDIESGAWVNVKGKLIVEGMIGPSFVRCAGALEVKGGIVTGHNGWVQAGSSIRCNFIENSDVQVRGDLVVQRSILNSSVIAGGEITLVDSRRGLIAGGSVSSWSAIRTAQCGLAQGAPTECRIGSDFQAERRLKRGKQRLLRLKEYHLQLVKGLKEIEAKQNHRTGEQQSVYQRMQERAQKAERIAQHLGQSVESLENRMKWNLQAVLVVSGVLDKTVKLIVAGSKVAHPESLKGIFATGTPFRGSSLIDLEQLEEYQKAFPDSPMAGSKKAG